MFQEIVEFELILSAGGQLYKPRVYGDQDAGTWDAWVVFFPIPTGRVISTPREITQTSYEALCRWALTLDRVYLEGALVRALDTDTGVAMVPRTVLAQAEATAAAELIALHRAAERARIKAASETTVAEMHERAAAAARTDAAEFRCEQEDLEALAAESAHETAKAAAVAHESAAREAWAVAAETNPTKNRKRMGRGRRKGR